MANRSDGKGPFHWVTKLYVTQGFALLLLPLFGRKQALCSLQAASSVPLSLVTFVRQGRISSAGIQTPLLPRAEQVTYLLAHRKAGPPVSQLQSKPRYEQQNSLRLER